MAYALIIQHAIHITAFILFDISFWPMEERTATKGTLDFNHFCCPTPKYIKRPTALHLDVLLLYLASLARGKVIT